MHRFHVVTFFALLLIAGCGGGGGGSPSTPPPPPPAATVTNADIVGTWDVAIDGAAYCRVVFDLDGNMTSCSDTTFHVGAYLIRTSPPYPPYPPASYDARFLIQNDWIEPNPLQIFTSTIYAGYLTTDKQTWLGTYTSTRLNNGATVGTQTGTFRATKVPSGPG